jgi:hypothetical protein
MSADNHTASTQSVREESLRWLLSIAGGVALFLPVAAGIQLFYQPSVPARMATAQQLLISTANVRPEPVESLLFRCGIVVIITGMWLCYRALSSARWLPSLAQDKKYLAVSVIAILSATAILYLGAAAPNPIPDEGADASAGQSNFSFFFSGFYIGKYLWVYVFVIFPTICWLLLAPSATSAYKRVLRTTATIAGWSFFCALMVGVVVMNTVSFPYSWQNKNDFDAVYYSMTQVFSGVPMLVHGFTNTYGLYPHFLLPLFRVTGLSVTAFSLTMSVLLVVAFTCNALFLWRLVRSRVVLFSGMLTLLFFSYFDFRLQTPFDSVFAFFPIRYIGPSVVCLLAARYFYHPAKWLYYTLFIISGYLILWNPEFGIISFGAWVLANVYHDRCSATGAVQLRKAVQHLLIATATLFFVFGSWAVFVFVAYGSWPALGSLFSVITVFSGLGLNMLPMVLIHPWNVVALIQCTGFLYAIVAWHKKRTTPRATMVLMTSLVSLGFLFYFQGRSHNWNFVCGAAFTIILLTLLTDELLQYAQGGKNLLLKGIGVIALFILLFSPFELLFDTGRIVAATRQETEKAEQALEQENFTGNAGFFLGRTSEGDKVHVLTSKKYEGLYFDGSKRMSASQPGIEDLFLKADLQRKETILRDSSFPVFIEPYNITNMPFLAGSLAIIGASYQFSDVHETMYYLTKRTTHLPAPAFFDTTGGVFYRKYSDENNVAMRMHDAAGCAAVSLSSSYSVQALFFPGVQVFPFATVVGNASNDNGFLITKVLFSPNYSISVNGKSTPFPVPFNQWIYLVVNVFPDKVDIYENDSLTITFPLFSPYRQSSEALCIGNITGQHYFVGPIAEVSLANGTTDKQKMTATWQRIQNNIGR